MKKLILVFAAILFMASTCKEPTPPQEAECNAGYLPCDGDRSQCCEVTCDDGFYNCGETLTECCMDSTSHYFTWTIDTLGIYGSYLNDVAIVDGNNIWAVGNIETDSGSYNAARWNGEEWELIRIQPQGYVIPIQCIYFFNENDIWFGQGGLPIQWNGNEYYLYTPANGEHPGQPSIDSIWGTSSSDLYFIGRSGSIVHYDGANFMQMDSGTDVDLKFITGTGPDNIWVSTGYSTSTLRYVLLHYDGNEWEIRIDSHFTPDPNDPVVSDSIYSIRGIYADDPDIIWVNTSYGLYKADSRTYGAGERIYDHNWEFANLCLTGNGSNDIFGGGAYNETWHYNGRTVYRYHLPVNPGIFHGVDSKGDMVVFTGESADFRGIILRGIRQ